MSVGEYGTCIKKVIELISSIELPRVIIEIVGEYVKSKLSKKLIDDFFSNIPRDNDNCDIRKNEFIFVDLFYNDELDILFFFGDSYYIEHRFAEIIFLYKNVEHVDKVKSKKWSTIYPIDCISVEHNEKVDKLLRDGLFANYGSRWIMDDFKTKDAFSAYCRFGLSLKYKPEFSTHGETYFILSLKDLLGDRCKIYCYKNMTPDEVKLNYEVTKSSALQSYRID
jgi:hypothetical protein